MTEKIQKAREALLKVETAPSLRASNALWALVAALDEAEANAKRVAELTKENAINAACRQEFWDDMITESRRADAAEERVAELEAAHSGQSHSASMCAAKSAKRDARIAELEQERDKLKRMSKQRCEQVIEADAEIERLREALKKALSELPHKSHMADICRDVYARGLETIRAALAPATPEEKKDGNIGQDVGTISSGSGIARQDQEGHRSVRLSGAHAGASAPGGGGERPEEAPERVPVGPALAPPEPACPNPDHANLYGCHGNTSDCKPAEPAKCKCGRPWHWQVFADCDVTKPADPAKCPSLVFDPCTEDDCPVHAKPPPAPEPAPCDNPWHKENGCTPDGSHCYVAGQSRCSSCGKKQRSLCYACSGRDELKRENADLRARIAELEKKVQP